MHTVAVIDYGMGNLHSVSKALEHVAGVNSSVIVTSDSEVIARADRVVLPGVGAIRDCMAEIRRTHIDRVVHKVAESGRPLLGVCVGMQVMLAFSEENGGVECFNLLPGQVNFFGKNLKDEQGNKLKVPHMGWSPVCQSQPHPLWHRIKDEARFYFVHSFHAHAVDPLMSLGQCDYGVRFDAALAKDNIVAVQFHPEKSSENGLKLLHNFLRWKP